MARRLGRYWILASLVALLALASAGLTQGTNPNERYIKEENPVVEAEAARGGKLWVLDFIFKDPRLITVDIPGRGRRLCWYLWYQIVNRTGEPRSFIPDFELVPLDPQMKGMVYRDEVLPAVQAAIARELDPLGHDQIKNSVTIAAEPIPATLPKASPRKVTGVAIWTDPNEPNPYDDEATLKAKAQRTKLIDSNRYDIFVAGLSNGWSLTDPIPPSKKPVVRRKTLQLSFKRLGDKHLKVSEAIRFMPPAQWLYRASQLELTLDKDKEKPRDK